MTKEFSSVYKPTTGETTSAIINIKLASINVTFHDTAGQFDFDNIRKQTYKNCDPNRTIILMCYSAEDGQSLKHIESVWHPEINSSCSEFTQVLVRLKEDSYIKNFADHAPLSEAKELQKRLKINTAVSCDSLTYCNANGKRGSVDKVFLTAINTHLQRNLLMEPHPNWPCKCVSQEEEEEGESDFCVPLIFIRSPKTVTQTLKKNWKKEIIPCCMNIILVGDSCTGKTCLLDALLKNKFSSQAPYLPTEEVEQKTVVGEVFGNKTVLNFFDTSGSQIETHQQERMKLYESCEPFRTIVIFCVSADDEDTLKNIETVWNPEINENFTKVLVRLQTNNFTDENYHISISKLKNMAKKIQTSYFYSCDSKLYCEREGKDGDVYSMFSYAIRSHVARYLSTDNKWPCNCNVQDEDEEERKRKISVPRLPYYMAV